MNIREFCEKHPKQEKVLLAGDVKNGNVLMRKLNEEGVDVKFLKVARLADVAKEIVIKNYALEGKLVPVRTLPYDGYLMILEKLVSDGIDAGRVDFVPKESMCREAVTEIFLQMNQLRMGRKNDITDISGELSDKYEQLEALIAEYENQLRQNNIYDDVRFIKEADSLTAKADDAKKLIEEDVIYAVLNDAELTYIENELAGRLVRRYTALGHDKVSMEMSNNADGIVTHFYRTYGIVNEIDYIIEYIEKNKIPFGDVNILYSSKAYDNYLGAELGARRVPYAMLSPYSAMGFYSLNLLVDLLDWVEKDYSYQALLKLFNNKYMSLGYDIKDSRNNDENDRWTSPFNCFIKGIRANIGWGLERYKKYAEESRREIAQSEKENGLTPRLLDKKRFADCLEDMTKDFAIIDRKKKDNRLISPAAFWEALYGTFRRHFRVKQNQEWAVLKSSLDDVGRAVGLKKEASFENVVKEIRKELENITVSDMESEAAVAVINLKKPVVLDRKYNFFIGLGAVDFKVNNGESPVLSDAELTTLLDGSLGYLKLGKNAEKERKEYYTKTLNSLGEGKVFFGYSYYDVFNMRESSPSTWFLECLEKYGEGMKLEEIEKKREMEHLKEKIKVVNDEAYLNSLEKLENKTEYTNTVNEPYVFSATSLQTLINCPLGYKYEKVDYIPKEEFDDVHPGEWLNAADKGTLVHAVLEEYCNRVLKKEDDSREKISSTPDKAAFEEIFEAACIKLKEVHQPVSDKVYERAKNIYKDMLAGYLARLHTELSDEKNKWKIFACELKFGGDNGAVIYEFEKSGDGKKKYKLSFNGSIDRVDTYEQIEKNDEGQEVKVRHFRIVDYKTVKDGGKLRDKCQYIKYEKKTDNYIMPHQIQHFIYAIALKNKYPDAVIDEIIYECLMDEKTPQVRFPEDIPVAKLTRKSSSDTLKHVADKQKEMKENQGKLPDMVENLIAKTVGCGEFDVTQSEVEADKGRCEFCSYVDMCMHSLGEKI